MENSKGYMDYTNMGAVMEVRGRSLLIQISKELDHHNAVTIREKADQLIDKNSVNQIIFDFTNSEFMDSSGIGVIMGRYKKIIFTGGKVVVTNVNSSIDRIFKLSGLYKIIEKYATIEEVLNLQ
ncbi:anti-sigma F factor antagonist [Anaerosporobacter sp.]|uniref:anti-sigma F factor antagonist n=1 Tax=Anaerosporobacter sp. TaxID=1872529 RepID=UPI0025FF64D9|nr:anti-sigma F factor antagonist [Anaerosporobacter sp.]